MEDVYTLCSAAWIYFTEGRENRDVSPQGMIAEKRKQFSRAVDFYVRAFSIDLSCAVAAQGLAIISAEDVPLGSAIRPGTESHRRTRAASEALDIFGKARECLNDANIMSIRDIAISFGTSLIGL